MSTESAVMTSEATAEGLFVLLWESMADLLGTAATATLLRRAIQGGSAREPALASVTTGRKGMTYGYAVPGAWQQALDQESLAALQALTQELYPLLIEMTGPVVVRRLARVGALRRAGLAPHEDVIG